MSAGSTTTPFFSWPLGQRVCAVWLTVVQCWAMGFLSRDWTYPATMMVLAAVALLLPWRLDVSRRMRFWLLAGTFSLFLLKSRVAPLEFPFGREFIRTQVAHSIAQGLLAMQLIELIWKRDRPLLPVSFALLSVAGLVAACDVQIAGQERHSTMPMLVSFAIPLGMFLYFSRVQVGPARSSLLPGLIIMGLLAVVVYLGGSFSANLLYSNERTIERFILDLLDPGDKAQSQGFSGRARLDSIQQMKQQGGSAIALRVEAEHEPGYLRASVFTDYRSPEWRDFSSRNDWLRDGSCPVLEQADLPGRVFTWNNGVQPADQGELLTVWKVQDTGSELFTPLGTAHLKAPVEEIAVTEWGTFSTRDLEPGAPYACLKPAEPEFPPLPENVEYTLLHVPPDVDPGVRLLAQALFLPCLNDEQKIQAVQHYFHTNYQYQFGIEVPAGREPLTWFLLERPAAHCEFFASGTTLLLRLGGVPCRYVTGFVVAEQNSFSGEWIARNQHAHAWVEAWTADRGWVTVESTPADGVPDAEQTQPNVAFQFWEALRNAVDRLRTQWAVAGFSGLLRELARMFSSLPGLLVLATFVGWLFWRFRHLLPRRFSRPPLTPVGQMQQILNRLLKQLEQQGWTKAPHETLHQFARRLETAGDPPLHQTADWLRHYARERYRSDLTAEVIQRMQAEMPALSGAIK